MGERGLAHGLGAAAALLHDPAAGGTRGGHGDAAVRGAAVPPGFDRGPDAQGGEPGQDQGTDNRDPTLVPRGQRLGRRALGLPVHIPVKSRRTSGKLALAGQTPSQGEPDEPVPRIIVWVPQKHDRMPVIRDDAPGAQIRDVSAPMPHPGGRDPGDAACRTRSANR